jgi:hypothetical protein
MYSSKNLVLRFDNFAENGLSQSLSNLGFSRSAHFKILQTEFVAIIENVFKLVHAPEYNFICFNSAVTDRLTNSTEAEAKSFTTELKFCLK